MWSHTLASYGNLAYPAMNVFHPGTQYSRRDVLRLLGIRTSAVGGNWYTGYTTYENELYIFCGVGTPGRTGHDYHNRIDGDTLLWYGKTGSRLGQPLMR